MERDEGAGSAFAPSMNEMGEHFLAGARFSSQIDRERSGGCFFSQPQDLPAFF